MTAQRFGRIFWSFIWRFWLVFIAVSAFIGLFDMMFCPPQNYIARSDIRLEDFEIDWVGFALEKLVATVPAMCGAAYGLWGMFRSRYPGFRVVIEERE